MGSSWGRCFFMLALYLTRIIYSESSEKYLYNYNSLRGFNLTSPRSYINFKKANVWLHNSPDNRVLHSIITFVKKVTFSFFIVSICIAHSTVKYLSSPRIKSTETPRHKVLLWSRSKWIQGLDLWNCYLTARRVNFSLFIIVRAMICF